MKKKRNKGNSGVLILIVIFIFVIIFFLFYKRCGKGFGVAGEVGIKTTIKKKNSINRVEKVREEILVLGKNKILLSQKEVDIENLPFKKWKERKIIVSLKVNNATTQLLFDRLVEKLKEYKIPYKLVK